MMSHCPNIQQYMQEKVHCFSETLMCQCMLHLVGILGVMLDRGLIPVAVHCNFAKQFLSPGMVHCRLKFKNYNGMKEQCKVHE